MLGDLLVGEKMEKCDGCDYIKRIVHIEERVAEQNKRLSVLESFVEWAEPIIRRIEDMQKDVTKLTTSQNYMSMIFGGFVVIVAYVYTVQITKFMEEQPKDKIEIIREIHKLESSFDEKLKEQSAYIDDKIIMASKINHSATVRKVDNIVKNNKE